MNRRNFFKKAILSGVSIAGIKDLSAANKYIEDAQTNIANQEVITISGGEPEEMLDQAMMQLGGMSKFIAKGDVVCIKPDIAWNQPQEMASTTNPKLVAHIVKQCFEAGAKEVTVFDHTINDWRLSYASSGIKEAAESAGAKMLPAHMQNHYKKVALPYGTNIKSAEIHKAILDADKWINVPVLKHHGSIGHSGAHKNYMGIVWDRQELYNNGTAKSINDICTFSKKPVLNIVDAYRVITSKGPKGGDASDVKLTKTLLVSQNIDAIEISATKFLNQLTNNTIV